MTKRRWLKYVQQNFVIVFLLCFILFVLVLAYRYEEPVYGRNGAYLFRVSDRKIPVNLGGDKEILVPSEYLLFSVKGDVISRFLKKEGEINRKRTDASIMVTYPEFAPLPISAKTGLMYSDDVIAFNLQRKWTDTSLSKEERYNHLKSFLLKQNKEGQFFYVQEPEILSGELKKYNSDSDIVPKTYPNVLYAMYENNEFKYSLSCESDYGYGYALCSAGQWPVNDYINYTLYVRERHVADMDEIHNGVKTLIKSFVSENSSTNIHSAFLTICDTSNAHMGPKITYRVAGDEIVIGEFLIPSDYLIFNNGCQKNPETVSREDIEKGYLEIKENKRRHPNRIFNYPLYAVFPDFKPLEIEKSFSHVKKPSVTHLNDLIIISIGNGMHIAKPPIDPQPYLRSFSKTEPIQLEGGIVKYEYDPVTANAYPNQFDKYFQEKDGQFVRYFRCRRDFENEELGECEYTFGTDNHALDITVSFNRNRIQDIEEIEAGAKKLVQSFVSAEVE